MQRTWVTLQLMLPLIPCTVSGWQLGVEELSTDDEEISDYVRALEETQDTAELPEATGEAIAREFERYLRRREN